MYENHCTHNATRRICFRSRPRKTHNSDPIKRSHRLSISSNKKHQHYCLNWTGLFASTHTIPGPRSLAISCYVEIGSKRDITAKSVSSATMGNRRGDSRWPLGPLSALVLVVAPGVLLNNQSCCRERLMFASDANFLVLAAVLLVFQHRCSLCVG
jgi:hypothetical protein